MTSSKDEEYAKKITDANEKFAKTAEEIRKQENERIMQDYQNAQMQKRRMEYAMAMEELRNKHKVNKGTDRETTLWDEAMHEADRAISAGELTNNHDFRSAMMALLAMYGKLNKAIAVSREQTFGEYYNKYVYEKNGDPIGNMWIKLKGAMRDAVKGDGEIDIPALQHNVSFKDGKLQIEPLTRKDGAPLVVYQRDEKGNIKYEMDENGKPKLDDKGQMIKVVSTEPHPANEGFKSLVDAWLLEHDYIFVPDEPGKYKTIDGKYLDEEEFKRIAPTFGEFLERTADLTFEDHSPALRG
ncbi:membrane-associated HD superfamily hydrolase [Legionella gratiana]|uniref:Membrane-associated HD superfamily hydrolase n=1 Tax=Legionella gratiana TaxID=45066 RepID=A0A378J9C9_9GAMM|nr:hypothetical protein [Legionella gratiana]KTD11153.1 membrane-associated HD superfamily hydrolase [Legionella gratiana]STX44382.1 membrane-associated HD superfamily hydrolase [Legionella gratiana]